MKSKEKITVTPSNLLLLIVALLFLVFTITYGLNTAEREYNERKANFLEMPIDRVGGYIAEKNSRKNRIDSITTVRPIHYKNGALYIDYDIKKGFLQAFVGKIESLDETKERVKTDLISENCSKSSHSAFLQKGGVIYYRYHLRDKDMTKPLFSFEVRDKDCV
jgi:hypothetical protein